MGEQSNQTNKVIVIIVIIVIVLAGGAGGWYFLMYKPEQEAKERARLERIAKEEAEEKRKQEEAQKKARYEELIANADSEFDQENWGAAQPLYAEALSLFPEEAYPQDQLILVNTKLDELAELEARKAAGEVEMVSSRTGRFYVVVSSSIDDDLAMDYATKLAKEGNIVKLIEHDTDSLLYYRVSVADHDTWDQAVTATGSFSAYGNGEGIWVLKY